MKSAARKDLIIQLLKQRDSVSVNELLRQLPVSPATVRRDLSDLKAAGRIVKTYGKISLADVRRVLPFSQREMQHSAEKLAIAKAAAKLVCEGDTVIIDSGTTASAFAEQLRGFTRLSVITNALSVAALFNGTAVTTYVCGGMVDDMALIDSDATAYFASRQVDKAFVAATGIRGEEGLTVSSSLQLPVKRKMIESAKKVYALFDASKFDFLGISLFADFSELTGIVTDKPIANPKLRRRLEELGVDVIVADV